MKVFLTGFMGTGKTAVGARLAEKMGMEFVDLDLQVEQSAGLSVAEIFAEQGEAEFRRQEQASLREVCDRTEELIIATGGGVVLEAANRELMGRQGITIWLDTPLTVIRQRLGHEAGKLRPLYSSTSAIEAVFESRRSDYSKADRHVRVGEHENQDQVAERVAEILASEGFTKTPGER